MPAVKKLMPESLLNYRFRGTTVSYDELLIALENIIIDKVATIPQPETGRLTRVPRWRLAWQRKMMVEIGEKRKINESCISHCKLSTEDQALEYEALDWVKAGMKKDTKVAKMQIREERTEGRGVPSLTK